MGVKVQKILSRHNAYFRGSNKCPRDCLSLSRRRLRRDTFGSMSLMGRRNVSRNLFVSARNTIHHGEQNARYDEGEVQTRYADKSRFARAP